MAFQKSIYADAVPAPLRIPIRHPRASDNPDSIQASQAPRCSMLSKLPAQPVFRPAERYPQEAVQTPTKTCSCPKSPTSLLNSPLSPRTTSFSTIRGPSLDFSALSMRSPTLRHDLENCTCHQTGNLAHACPTLHSEFPYRGRGSPGSGYASIYSC